jgi:beta-1,4-mannosyl-glycoprotein beta-1,4-N-acetylglucosaminyltransferase
MLCCGRVLRKLLLLLRKRLKLILIACLFLTIQYLLWLHPAQSLKQYILKLTYFTRPLWDKPEAPFTMIDHYYAPGMTMEDQCKRHGWTVISNQSRTDKRRKVFDAVLFSIEIELLLV